MRLFYWILLSVFSFHLLLLCALPAFYMPKPEEKRIVRVKLNKVKAVKEVALAEVIKKESVDKKKTPPPPPPPPEPQAKTPEKKQSIEKKPEVKKTEAKKPEKKVVETKKVAPPPPQKKSLPKKEEKKVEKPSPSPKNTVKEEKKKALLKEAAATLKSSANLTQEEAFPKKNTSSLQFSKIDFEASNALSSKERQAYEEVVLFLQRRLSLKNQKAVTLKITVTPEGRVDSVVVVSGDSENGRLLERELKNLKVPGFSLKEKTTFKIVVNPL